MQNSPSKHLVFAVASGNTFPPSLISTAAFRAIALINGGVQTAIIYDVHGVQAATAAIHHGLLAQPKGKAQLDVITGYSGAHRPVHAAEVRAWLDQIRMVDHPTEAHVLVIDQVIAAQLLAEGEIEQIATCPPDAPVFTVATQAPVSSVHTHSNASHYDDDVVNATA